MAEFKERKGKGPTKELKLQHVEESLDSLAAAAGLEPLRVRPFLEQQGIQQELEGPPGIQVKILTLSLSLSLSLSRTRTRTRTRTRFRTRTRT